jgi:hypothetical protein
VAKKANTRGITIATILLAVLGSAWSVWQAIVSGNIFLAFATRDAFNNLSPEESRIFWESSSFPASVRTETIELVAAANDFVAGLTIVLIAIFSAFAILVGISAERKGRGFWPFYLFSLILSPLVMGLIVAILAPAPQTMQTPPKGEQGEPL